MAVNESASRSISKRVAEFDADEEAKVKKAKKKVKKAKGKKGSTKKVGSKSASEEQGSDEVRYRIVIEATAPFEINSSRVEIISATPLQRSAPVTAAKEFSEKQSTEQDQKSSLRTGFAVIGGLILAAILAVAIFAVAKNDGNSTNSKPASPSATPTATPSATPSTVVTPSASPSPSATSSASPTPLPTSTVIPSATDLPPIGVNAFFNSTGATIFWRADPNASGISGYIIEASLNGGHFKLIDTLPASHHSHDVIETDSDGWTSFKVSAVYSDGAIVAGKLFGLAGTY